MKNRILLVDDDEVFQYTMKQILHEIKTIRWFYFETNGFSAIEFLEWCKSKKDFPDFIFLDLMMPGIDGFDFLEYYKDKFYAKYPDTKIYIVSSSNLEKDRKRSFSYPFVTEYFCKPVFKEKISMALA